MGDFNYVSHRSDRLNNFKACDSYIRNIFKPKEFSLEDSYRHFHKEPDFTRQNSRIDRIYVSDFLINKIDSVKHLNYIADHRPVFISIYLENTALWGNFYWKLNNSLLDDNVYRNKIIDFIKEMEDEKGKENSLSIWENFKNKIKKFSIKFGKTKAYQRKIMLEICKETKDRIFDGEIIEKIEEIEEEIQIFKIKGNSIRGKNSTLDNIYIDGKEINRTEEIRKGNSKFIVSVKNEEFGILNEKDEILEEIKDFYENLYSSQGIPDQKIENYLEDFNPEPIDPSQNENIGGFISCDEVRTAILDLNKNKSPGEDGLTPEFYLKFCNQIVPYLTELYNNIYFSENLAHSMKKGIITLIYKNKGNVSELKNWRPISLLNLDYKILTKLLANRLKCITDEILNPLQTSGSKGRNILNNVLNIKNIIHYIKQNNLKAALISFDNEKAFDRLEHNFIKKVLKKFGFHKNFLKWIDIIYKDMSSKVMVNGTFTEESKIFRSVRQGCPLSMLLYVICLEPLIYKINNNNSIKGLKIPNCKKEVKSIQHADDITDIIINDSSFKALEIENKKYSEASGSKINPEKTEILKFGNFESLSEEYVKKDVKILGCFFGENDLKLNFNKNIEKMKNTIQKWEHMKLNLIAKNVIIKTYILSILQYFLKIFPLSKWKEKRINKITFNYLWNNKKEKIARKVLYRSTYDGGIAVPNLECRSQANFIQTLRLMNENIDQPWTALFIYWFGFKLNFLYPEFAKNKWVHTLDIPKELNYFCKIMDKFKNLDQIWQINIKDIYNFIIEYQNFKSIVEIRFPQQNWKMIWKAVSSIKNMANRNTIYKYIFGVLPTGEYLYKHKILNYIPKCKICKTGDFTQIHIFGNCSKFKNKRVDLIREIKNLKKDIKITYRLIRFGNNQKYIDKIDLKIIKLVQDYVLDIWSFFKNIGFLNKKNQTTII